MIRALLWKEWHEQRWKLAFGCVIMMGVTAIGLKTRMVPDEPIVMLSTILGAFILPILIGMGVIATERAEGTLPSLLALPVRPWRILAVKMTIGAIALAMPFIGSTAAACLIAGAREVEISRILLSYACGFGFGLTLLIWMTAFGIRQPTEARAGLVGIAVVLGSGVINIIGDELFGNPWDDVILAIFPFGFFDVVDYYRGNLLLAVIIAQVVISIGLVIWTTIRLAKPGRTKA